MTVCRKYGRNALLGPDYATMDLRVASKMNLRGRYRLELAGESFNLFNRDNQRMERPTTATIIRRERS
jgi:hypothetical protein